MITFYNENENITFAKCPYFFESGHKLNETKHIYICLYIILYKRSLLTKVKALNDFSNILLIILNTFLKWHFLQ